MSLKTGNSPDLPLFVFPSKSRTERAHIAAWKAEGLIRKIAPRLYTSLPDATLEHTLRTSWPLIVSNLYPKSIPSYQTALTFKPNRAHEIFLTATENRKLKLPGLTIHFMRGPGADELDVDLFELKVSSFPRALLENLQPATGTVAGRKLELSELEELLERELTLKGEARLNSIRDQARAISQRLGFKSSFKKLDVLIGALLGTRPAAQLQSKIGIARSEGVPFDQNALIRFDLLAGQLNSNSLEEFPNFTSASHYTNKAFFESYFSNYIEGTRFLVSEAEKIIFEKQVPKARPLDAHDILGTFQIAGDPT